MSEPKKGFGFNLTPDRDITMWFNDQESPPLTTEQLNDIEATLRNWRRWADK